MCPRAWLIRSLPHKARLDPEQTSPCLGLKLSRPSLSLNLPAGMIVTTTVKITRKIMGDLCRAISPPGTVPRLAGSSPDKTIIAPILKLMRPRLRAVVDDQGHTARRWLSRAWRGGLLPSLPPLTCGLRNRPPLVCASTGKATEAQHTAWRSMASVLWTPWTGHEAN